jgi:PadR family transcriptional regulator, regulatory protein AphA
MPRRPNSPAGPLSPEYALLGLLRQQPDHGYDLHQRLSADLEQVWHISQSQVYNILNRLEAQGYVTAKVQKQAHLPDRRLFRLTAAGRRRFDTWFQAPASASVKTVRVEFMTRLYFAQRLHPEAVTGLIEAQTAEVRAGLERLQATLRDYPPEQIFNRLSLEFRLRQLQSLMGWLADCRTLFESQGIEP